MNRQDPSQELMKRENRGISRITMTSYPMFGPGIHNKSGSKPLMRNPLPFFPAQRPSLVVTSISHGLANKQTSRKRNDILITLKGAMRTLTFFFLLQTMDVWFAIEKPRTDDFHHHGFVMIIITMAIVYYDSMTNLENHIRHVIWLGYNLYIILNKFNINKLDKN